MNKAYIYTLIAQIAEVDKSKIANDTSLMDDLDLDSLSLLELFNEISAESDIVIEPDLQIIYTVGDVIDAAEEAAQNSAKVRANNAKSSNVE